MFDLQGYLEDKKDSINKALGQLWDHYRPYPTALVEAMRYSVDAGGKRLRPILCIAAAEAVGGSQETVMGAACALELIHTYSLIHDDLPAMDNDDLRRGKPTCHKVYGEAMAILAGDALLTAAFEVLAGRFCKGGDRVDDAVWLRVIRLIARAAGASGMIQGQVLDLAFEKKQASWEDLKGLQQLKTGALIEASVHIGVLVSGAQPRQVAAMRAYGRHIGLAFQVADDILNVEGDVEITGKPVGSDKILQKATGPSVLGLKQAKACARKSVDFALAELSVFGQKAAALDALARYIVERKR